MFSLPLVQRELLVAARRKSGTWLRVGSTAAAIALGTIWLVGIAIFGASASAGLMLFNVYKGMLYLAAVLCGTFLTADSLSSERRDGTLGLLFLTRLSGWQVVAGKLTSAAIRALLLIFGIAPVLSLTLLMGGVTSGDFWRLLLSITATLMLSLSVGMVVSAGARGAGAGFFYTLLFLAGWESAAFGADYLRTTVSSGNASTAFHWMSFSPLFTLSAGMDSSYSIRPGEYWRNVISLLVAAGVLAFIAAFIAQRHFHDTLGGSGTRITGTGGGRKPIRFGDTADPLKLLIGGGTWPMVIAWLPVPIFAMVQLAGLFASGGDAIFMTSMFSGLFQLPPLAMLAWIQAHQFAEFRQSGMLDVLLTTPLEGQRTPMAGKGILGSVGAIATSRIAPVLVTLFALQGFVILAHVLFISPDRSTAAGSLLAGGFTIGTQAIGAFLRFLSISRLGLWFALSEPKPNMAFVKTLGIAVLLPLLIPCPFVEWALNGGLLGWAQYRLNNPLREMLARNPARG